MKKYILTSILFFIMSLSFSQDIIHLKRGTEIKAKVIEIGAKEIKYKKFDFQDGPTYQVLKKEIEYILYENGKKDMFYKNLNSQDAEELFHRKINQYQNTKNLGSILVGAGVVGAVILTTNLDKVNEKNAIAYSYGYMFSIGATVAGTVLFFNSKRKIKQYSKKLSKLQVGLSLSKKHKGVSLIYRF